MHKNVAEPNNVGLMSRFHSATVLSQRRKNNSFAPTV